MLDARVPQDVLQNTREAAQAAGREGHKLSLKLRQLLDLDADPIAISRVLGADPILKPVVTAEHRPAWARRNAFLGRVWAWMSHQNEPAWLTVYGRWAAWCS